MVIAGNHDSDGLFRVLAEAVGDAGAAGWDDRTYCTRRIRFLGKPCLPEAGAVTRYRVEGGPDIRLGCLPFVHANRLVKDFDELAIANATYAEKIRIISPGRSPGPSRMGWTRRATWRCGRRTCTSRAHGCRRSDRSMSRRTTRPVRPT